MLQISILFIIYTQKRIFIYEPRHDKTNKMSVHPVFFMRTSKTLIRLGGCPGWSESSLDVHSLWWFYHVVAHIKYKHGITVCNKNRLSWPGQAEPRSGWLPGQDGNRMSWPASVLTGSFWTVILVVGRLVCNSNFIMDCTASWITCGQSWHQNIASRQYQ